MSRIAQLDSTTVGALLLAVALTGAGSIPLHAQYVGHVDENQDNHTPTLRATAVLEYTGDLDKPTAARLIPIAVWDGERYEPGGLYLAQPVPLTVEPGTQYILQVAGTPKGMFDVNGAANVEGSWIAIGTFQKPAPVTVAKLRPSRIAPHVVEDDDKPHFAHTPSDTNTGSTTASTSQPSAPVDPDRPTLHQRTAGSSTPSSPSTTAPASTPAATPASTDPDRPTLHRTTTSPNDNGAPVSASNVTDPDRPHLGYGRPQGLESLDAPAAVASAKVALAKAGPELEQIAAVSDAANRRPHSFVYTWTDPDDAQKMQSALEAVAQHLLTQSPQSVTTKATNTHTATRPVTNSTAAHRRTAKPAPLMLTDEQFKAYELTYGGGATLIFSASTGEGDAKRYITLIAQPDFNGAPILLFKQITSQRELDILPRMKLVDAVDTDADNRAELIFALENTTGRQYAIYRVANNKVEKVFTTGT